MLLCVGAVTLLAVAALAVSGQWEQAARTVLGSVALLAWYAVCLTVVTQVRARRVRGAEGQRSAPGRGRRPS